MVSILRNQPNSKVTALCEQLRTMALQKGPENKLPTGQELCALFGTNNATLNDALDILEAQNVLYRKRGSGIYVSPKIYRKNICILLDASKLHSDRASPFWGMLLGLFAQEARHRSACMNEYYSLHILAPPIGEELSLPEEVMEMLQLGRVHGFLVVGLEGGFEEVLRGLQIPYVSFTTYSPYMVLLDVAMQIELAIRCLVEQGCRRIGYWTPYFEPFGGSLESATESLETIRWPELLARYQIEYDPRLVCDVSMLSGSGSSSGMISYHQQGHLLATHVFGQEDGPRPDGIVCTNDLLAEGVVATLPRLGVYTGKDVKIATNGNTGLTMLLGYTEGVTVIEIDPRDIMQAMFDLLHALLTGQIQEKEKTISVQPKVRQSEW